MTLDEARAEYEQKHASVIELDVNDLDAYAGGVIVMKNGRSYGIFSLPEDVLAAFDLPMVTTTRTTTTTGPGAVSGSGGGSSASTGGASTSVRTKSAYASVSELLASVDEDDIDPDAVERIESMIEHFRQVGVDTIVAITPDPRPFSVVEDADVVITVKERDRFAQSEMVDGTLYVDTTEKGSVGALLVAPGNVVSTRTLTNE